MDKEKVSKEVPSSIRKMAHNIKKKHSNIYYISIGNSDYIVRPLTKGEFNVISDVQKYDINLSEDMVLETCILYPKINRRYIDNMLAGEVASLLIIIANLSGFTSSQELERIIKEERSNMDLVENQIIMIICKAFPHIKPEDIDNFDAQKLCHYLALSERILEVSLEFKPNEIDPKIPIDFEKDNKDFMSF